MRKKRDVQYQGNNNKKELYYCIVEVKEFRIPSKILKKNEKVKATYESIAKPLIISFKILSDNLIKRILVFGVGVGVRTV